MLSTKVTETPAKSNLSSKDSELACTDGQGWGAVPGLVQQLRIIRISLCPLCPTMFIILAFLLYVHKMGDAASVTMILFPHARQEERVKDKKLSSPRSYILVPIGSLLHLTDETECHAAPRPSKGHRWPLTSYTSAHEPVVTFNPWEWGGVEFCWDQGTPLFT